MSSPLFMSTKPGAYYGRRQSAYLNVTLPPDTSVERCEYLQNGHSGVSARMTRACVPSKEKDSRAEGALYGENNRLTTTSTNIPIVLERWKAVGPTLLVSHAVAFDLGHVWQLQLLYCNGRCTRRADTLGNTCSSSCILCCFSCCGCSHTKCV